MNMCVKPVSYIHSFYLYVFYMYMQPIYMVGRRPVVTN